MGIVDNALIGASGQGGYFLSRSVRLRSSASASLSRTFGAPTNNKIWTISVWAKRGNIGSRNFIAGTNTTGGTNAFYFDWDSDALEFGEYTSSWQWRLVTTQVFRDPSAWYHIVVAVDTTQATSSNRVKMYVNGSQVTAFSTASYPTQNLNTYWNQSGQAARFGEMNGASLYYDGYLTEVNFVDGQALTPSSFGETDTITGVWQPARYGGTYGTNGFYLPFTDNSALTTSSNVGLGKDFSGNGNYWTTNNISITAGTTYDSMTDVPTLTSATAANFAVLNPLDKYSSITVSGGNLNAICADVAWRSGAMTFGNFTTGKWYYEVTATNIGGSTYISAGWELASLNHTAQSNGVGAASGNNFGVLMSTTLRQTKVNGTGFSSDSNTNANGDVLMIAVDFDAGKGWVGKNGTWYDSGNPSAGTNPCTTTVSGGLTPAYQTYNNGGLSANFGQRPFSYTPPTGYVALNTYNLPTSTIVKGNTVMDAYLNTGNGTARTDVIAFQPDLVWSKSRSASGFNIIQDSVRGAGNRLITDGTYAEAYSATYGSFTSTGFAFGSDANVNTNAVTYVDWFWKAGQGTTSTNTNGSITSTVSVNASAGFSVVTYTTTAGVKTVGHGLGVAPALIIVKPRAVVADWYVYGSSYSNTQYLKLNTTDALITDTNLWNSTTATSSVFTLGSSWSSGNTMVAYCWAPIAGYSSMGSFTGNGSSDGVFVYTGFQPKWVLVKKTSATDDWVLFDATRSPYNVVNNWLLPNSSGAELTSVNSPDLLSNGFKMRSTSGATNASGATYVYIAFATNPFKNSLAR